ncbi:MAG: DUF2339 domain-containing protein [Kiritimatiellia bacterium]
MGALFFFAILLILALVFCPIATLIVCKKIQDQQQMLQDTLWEILAQLPRKQSPEQTPQPNIVPTAPETASKPDSQRVRTAPQSLATPPPVPQPPTKPHAAPQPQIARQSGLQEKTTPDTDNTYVEPAPGTIETIARQIIARIWNWIIVGEEYRNPNVSAEYAVATNWLVRTGVIIMVVGVGFFLDYTSSRGWLGPLGKVGIAFIVGATLLAIGIQLLGKRYHLLGQGLLGAGVAVLYGSIFTAYNVYSLIGPAEAFGLMVLVTVGTGVMAIRFNSMLVAILGIIGGYGTPLMLATGNVNFIGLYSYMLLLGVGVLGVARYRNWHLLNAMAFVATWLLACSALHGGFAPARYWEVTPFLTAFFILFSTVIFLYQVMHRVKASLVEILMLMLNAAVYFGIMFHLTQDTYERIWTAIPAIGLAAFYTAHLIIFLRRGNRDRVLALSFTALAAFFLILTLPILISGAWLTLCWSIQAVILLWMAIRLRSRFLQWIAYLLYGIVALRFLFLDLYVAFEPAVLAETTARQYLWILLERLVTFGVPAATFAVAMRMLGKPAQRAGTLAVAPENDVDPIAVETRMPAVFGTLLFALVFLYLHLELHRSMLFAWDPLRLPLLTALWTAACLVLLRLFLKFRHSLLLTMVLIFSAITVAKLFLFDLPVWGASAELFRYQATLFLP